MNGRNWAFAPYARLVGTITLAAGLTAHAHAQRDPGLHHDFTVTPPASIAFGQTLRVTFLNVGSNPLEIIPCVFDGDGAHLKTGPAVTLTTGQTRSLDLSYSEMFGRAAGPTAVRAGVHADKAHLKYLMVAGEVIDDADGKTALYVPGYINPPDPVRGGRVTRSLAPVGITAGQTLRVTYLNVGSNPVEIIPCVFDGDGGHVKTGAPLRLTAGQMRSLELSRREVGGSRNGPSALVRGAAHVDRSDAKNLVVAGEVVEDSTGRSTIYLGPGTAHGFDPQPDPPAPRR